MTVPELASSTEGATSEILLQVEKMIKVRAEDKREVIINIPSFKVHQRDFVAVIGANGSGKSTFLDMLGLILSPSRVDTFELEKEKRKPVKLNHLSDNEKIQIRRKHIAYILQSGGLLEFLTIDENIHFAARLSEKTPEKIRQVIEQLKIQDILSIRPGKLSRGQRQKAAIALALVQQRALILADEPTSALDTQSATHLMETFRFLTQEAGVSLVMVTHDHRLIRNTADHIYQFHTREITPGKISSVLLLESSVASKPRIV